MTSGEEHIYKILLLGESGAGKSSVILRYSDDTFTDVFISTFGIDFKLTRMEVDGERIRLQIWDTAGQERFKTITRSYYRGAKGIILVYDVTSKDSLDNIENWLDEIRMYSEGEISMVLIGNKSDLVEERTVRFEDGQILAKKLGIPFLETSAKTNENISKAFSYIAEEIIKNRCVNVETLSRSKDIVLDEMNALKKKKFGKFC